jgi:hypothetical protein
MKDIIMYTSDHPEYRLDPDLNWLQIPGITKPFSSDFVTVIYTKTGRVYTGSVNGGSFNLGNDVRTFVTRKRKSK